MRRCISELVSVAQGAAVSPRRPRVGKPCKGEMPQPRTAASPLARTTKMQPDPTPFRALLEEDCGTTVICTCREIKEMRTARMLLVCSLTVGVVWAEPLTLPLKERPEWLRRDGIVMAGSWEPLVFRVRRDGSEGYTPTPEQRAAYVREHSMEMLSELKSLGVNFVMMHCYKGFGLTAERESMEDAVRFAKLCHDEGLRVGVYAYSGAFGWELLFPETPEARDWVVLDAEGKPTTYGSATYRYYWDRNHPGAQAFYRRIVRFAVFEIGSDLLHFDNYVVGPGSDSNSVARFRAFVGERFSPEQLSGIGISDPGTVKPPMSGPPENPLRRAWLEFSCRSLTASYHDMSRYARSLRRDILVECNPGGVGERIRPPVDHGTLLQGGEAFWDEGRPPGYRQGRLESRIPTYKVARRMDNMAFCYTTNPLEMAESMAFNLDSLGCICWFEYGKVAEKPGSAKPVSSATIPYVRFFRERRELLTNAAVVADVAVLRSFPSQVYGDSKLADLTSQVEQALILSRVPFQIIYDHHLEELDRYRALVLAGCVALSDRQVEQILRYVRRGGRLCVIGPAGTHDEWMLPRKAGPFDEAPSVRRLSAEEKDSVVDTVRGICPTGLSLSIIGPEGLCAELTEQGGRRLVHLVNYRSDGPAKNVVVRLAVPAGKRVKGVSLASPSRERDVAVSFEERGSMVEFAAPDFEVYEIAVVELESPGSAN